MRRKREKGGLQRSKKPGLNRYLQHCLATGVGWPWRATFSRAKGQNSRGCIPNSQWCLEQSACLLGPYILPVLHFSLSLSPPPTVAPSGTSQKKMSTFCTHTHTQKNLNFLSLLSEALMPHLYLTENMNFQLILHVSA